MVVRDCWGKVVYLASKNTRCSLVLEAELQAINWVAGLFLVVVIWSSNSLYAVNDINGSLEPSYWQFGIWFLYSCITSSPATTKSYLGILGLLIFWQIRWPSFQFVEL